MRKTLLAVALTIVAMAIIVAIRPRPEPLGPIEPVKLGYITNREELAQKVLDVGEPVLLDFYTDWCGLCRQLEPVLESLNGEFGDRIKFYKINPEKDPDLGRTAIALGVEGFPTVVIVDGKKIKTRIAGVTRRSYLKTVIEEVLKEKDEPDSE